MGRGYIIYWRYDYLNKYLALFIIVIFVILTFISCGLSDKFSDKYASEKKNIIQVVTKEADGIIYTSKLIYNNIEYIYHGEELFFVTTPNLSCIPDEKDIIISWHGFRFGYSTMYYSETDVDPLFIYTPVHYHDLYFRYDYDYMADSFLIEGTDMEISLSQIISFDNKINSFPVSHESTVKVRLISQSNSRIKCDLEIFEYNNLWYSIAGQFYVTELSNNMVQELKLKDVIA